MKRIFNFAAGPATLPQSVLEQVRDELLDWRGTGMSVMEMSHRDKPFMSIAAEAEKDLRELLAVPANYKVLFLQGGATTQFATVPMNLLRGKTGADYIVNGAWGKKASKEAAKYCKVNVAAKCLDEKYNHIPDPKSWKLDPNAAYLHYTPNETIEGVEYQFVPDSKALSGQDVPLVADFSSSFLSRPIDVSKFGLIYAGAQKNAGPSGITFVIVRDDLIGQVHPALPSVFDYKQVAEAESMLNTPATFSWYVSGLVFKWIKSIGGLNGMAQINQRKSQLLYDYIDSQSFYKNPVAKDARSWMNVVFTLPEEALDADFLKGAKAAQLDGLKGHRSVGGMRASCYNAMPETGVKALVEYMREFARTKG
jgi:phosphoserine aminotransferase